LKNSKREITRLKKIIRYTEELKRVIEIFKIESYTDLDDEYIALSSITQTITNINELKKALNEQTLTDTPIFQAIKTGTTRNIAAHDYDSINTYAVYNVMTRLISEENIKEIEAVIDGESNPIEQ